jgi:thymidylate synthase
MNKLDQQYTDLLKTILEHGVDKKDRTGTGTKSIFGYTIRHNMKGGFPLLTTKKMPFKTIVTELLWFLRGDTNIKYLVDNNCHIWDGDAYKRYINYIHDVVQGENQIYGNWYGKEEFINKIKTDDEFAGAWGDLGPIYGKQWRSWNGNGSSLTKDCEGNVSLHLVKQIDQIQNLINDLKTNPDSRRLMVNAWNVGEIDQMVLPPCHYGFQVYTRELKKLERINIAIQRKLTHETAHLTKDFDYQKWCDEQNIPTRAISLMWNQRSVDTFLGLPFNIASYGLLLEIIAKEVNMVPEELIGNLGDVHLYSNHIEQAKEQIGRELSLDERGEIFNQRGYKADLFPFNGDWKGEYNSFNIPKRTREPFPLPTFDCPAIDEIPYNTFDELVFKLQPADFYMDDYVSHPTIKAPLSN